MRESMSRSGGFDNNSYHNGMTFHNLDENDQPTPRFSPIHLTSDRQSSQSYDKQRSNQSESSRWCSKACLIGLLIGLLIGCAIVIAVAVPIGVTRCGSSGSVTSVTTCPSLTTSSTPIPSCIGVISSVSNWSGTYLMDNGCLLTSSCCCLYNQITLIRTNLNQLQISGNVIGSCTNIGTTTLITIPYPTTFQSGFFWGSSAIRLQLGQDNSYLAFVNTANPYCSATALRTS